MLFLSFYEIINFHEKLPGTEVFLFFVFFSLMRKIHLSKYWSMETNVSSNIKNDYFLIHRQSINMFLIAVLTTGNI